MDPTPTRPLLSPAAWLYSAAMSARNAYYDYVPGVIFAAGVPVISVGNITAGGTGKTPLVMEIVRRLQRLGRRPGILSRGYRGTADSMADEVQEYQHAMPDVPVVVNPNRVAGAARAVQNYRVDCLVLDDAFQHRRLRRELDLIVVDALAPWGGGRVLPAGLLREPLTGLRRADCFVISRANQSASGVIEAITTRLALYQPQAPALLADIRPEALVRLDGSREEVTALREWTVLPVCGIGNPGTFIRLVEGLADHVLDPRTFSDHHRYSTADLDDVLAAARESQADLILTTRKDWVKLAALWKRMARADAPPLLRLDVRLDLQDPEDVLGRRLAALFT